MLVVNWVFQGGAPGGWSWMHYNFFFYTFAYGVFMDGALEENTLDILRNLAI